MLPGHAVLFQYKHDFYAPTFYSGRNIPLIADLTPANQTPAPYYLLVQESEVEEVQQRRADAEILLQSRTKAANGKEPLVLMQIGKSEAAPVP